MLVLSRMVNESILIGHEIRLMVIEIRAPDGATLHGCKVRIGIDAPRDVPVHRKEVADAIAAERRQIDSEATPGIGEDYA